MRIVILAKPASDEYSSRQKHTFVFSLNGEHQIVTSALKYGVTSVVYRKYDSTVLAS